MTAAMTLRWVRCLCGKLHTLGAVGSRTECTCGLRILSVALAWREDER